MNSALPSVRAMRSSASPGGTTPMRRSSQFSTAAASSSRTATSTTLVRASSARNGTRSGDVISSAGSIGRATTTSRAGVERSSATRWVSTRSVSGSAHWTSSTTSTAGSVDVRSTSALACARRNGSRATLGSSATRSSCTTPIARSWRPRWTSGQNGGVAPISGQRDHAVTTLEARRSARRCSTSVVLPAPAGPTTLTAPPAPVLVRSATAASVASSSSRPRGDRRATRQPPPPRHPRHRPAPAPVIERLGRRSVGDRAGGPQVGGVVEDAPFEVAEPVAGIQPGVLGQVAPGPVEHAQGVGLPIGAVQRLGREAVDPLAQGELVEGRLEQPERGVDLTGPQVDVRGTFDRHGQQASPAGDRIDRDGVVRELHQRLGDPGADRLCVRRRRGGRVALAREPPASIDQVLELEDVDASPRDGQPVPRRLGQQDLRPAGRSGAGLDLAAQAGDVGVQRRTLRAVPILVEEAEQPFGRQHLAGLQREEGEHEPLLRAPQAKGLAVPEGLHSPEQPHLHRGQGIGGDDPHPWIDPGRPRHDRVDSPA